MSFFKKRGADTVQTEPTLAAKKTNTDNPYNNARRSWNEHTGGLMSSLSLAYTVGIAGLLIGIGGVGGMAYIGSQSKIIPLVYVQDAAGNTVSVTRADRVPDAQIADYQTAVVNFITNMRMVTPDVELQRRAILNSYSYLGQQDPAVIKANEFLNGTKDQNPFVRAANETVSVDVRSVIEQTKDTWQIDWVETVRARDGTLKGKPYQMRALVSLYQDKKVKVGAGSFINPHAIFVRDYNWSKQL